MNEYINAYKKQMKKGDIPRTYKFIMDFMSSFRIDFQKKYPTYAVSGLYPGYMDMTYFAATPQSLRDKKLKIAIVFLHEECEFELWLAANNRSVSREYVKKFQSQDHSPYTLSELAPGVDAILVAKIAEDLNFDDVEHIKIAINSVYDRFIKYIEDLIN